jgi:hypothetical protein
MTTTSRILEDIISLLDLNRMLRMLNANLLDCVQVYGPCVAQGL